MYISEFIRNLQHDLVPVEPITYDRECIVSLLL